MAACERCELSKLETKIELNQTSRFDPKLTVGAFPCYSLGEKNNNLFICTPEVSKCSLKNLNPNLAACIHVSRDKVWTWNEAHERAQICTVTHHYFLRWFEGLECRKFTVICSVIFVHPAKWSFMSHFCRKYVKISFSSTEAFDHIFK